MPEKFDPKDISGQVLCGAIKEHQLSLNETLAGGLRQRSSPRLRFLVSHVVVVDALLGHFSVRAYSCSILQGRAAPVQCPALGLHQPAVGVCERPVAVWCHPLEPDVETVATDVWMVREHTGLKLQKFAKYSS